MDKRRGRPRASQWKTTAQACQLLGVSRWSLIKWAKQGRLRAGFHWKVVDPQAARRTYLWRCDRIELWQIKGP